MLYYSFFLYVTGFNYLIFCLQYGLHNTLNCKIWTLPLSVLFWVSWKVFMVPFAFLTEKDLLWLHVCESCSVMSDSLWPHGLYSPWNSLDQNTRVGSLSLLQGIFPTQGSNPGLLHCRQILYQLNHKGSHLSIDFYWDRHRISSDLLYLPCLHPSSRALLLTVVNSGWLCFTLKTQVW